MFLTCSITSVIFFLIVVPGIYPMALCQLTDSSPDIVCGRVEMQKVEQ